MNGMLEVDSQGEPAWAGTATLSVDDRGRLVRTDVSGEHRVLADLGATGTVTFVRPADHVLAVSIVAEISAPGEDAARESRYQVETVFHLANQSLP